MLHGLTKDNRGVIGFFCYWKGSASQKSFVRHSIKIWERNVPLKLHCKNLKNTLRLSSVSGILSRSLIFKLPPPVLINSNMGGLGLSFTGNDRGKANRPARCATGGTNLPNLDQHFLWDERPGLSPWSIKTVHGRPGNMTPTSAAG